MAAVVCESVAKCKSLKRIQSTLQFYQNAKSDLHIAEHMEAHSTIQLMDDYHHIKAIHLESGERHESNRIFNEIFHILSEQIKCDITNCQTYGRNRDSELIHTQKESHCKPSNNGCIEVEEEEDMKKDIDPSFVIYKENLDMIHVFFLHSIDCGFRPDTADDADHRQEAKDEDDDVDDEDGDGNDDDEDMECTYPSTLEHSQRRAQRLRDLRANRRAVEHNKFKTNEGW